MKAFHRLLYGYGAAPLIPVGFAAARPFCRKARLGWSGRKRLVSNAKEWRSAHQGRLAIIHGASAGEFEAALPLIKAFKSKGIIAVATLFSPSGYKIASGNPLPDYISYLPFDTIRGVRAFLKAMNPDVFVFCKHDIWPNVVWECERRGIPTALVNGNLHAKSFRLNPKALNFNREVFRSLTAVWAVSENHAQRIKRIMGDGGRVEVSGDTRFDRVVSRALDSGLELPASFTGVPAFICGSVWPKENFTLESFIEIHREHPEWKLIWAPHEPNDSFIASAEKSLDQAGISHIRFSQLKSGSDAAALIVDQVGKLASLYRFAEIAYVGGGFGKGVHSVIEPAVFSLPVIFGPNFHVSAEANELINRGGGLSVKGRDDFHHLLKSLIEDEERRTRCGEIAGNFVEEKAGVAEFLANEIMDLIDRHRSRSESI